MMAQADLEIAEDPDHPEGGHVLLRFANVTNSPQDPRVSIEPIDDVMSADWPIDLRDPVAVRCTPRGLEIIVGPEIGNAVPPGAAVRVSVPGSGLEAERLWPIITPMVSSPGKRQVGRPKRVVAIAQPSSQGRAESIVEARNRDGSANALAVPEQPGEPGPLPRPPDDASGQPDRAEITPPKPEPKKQTTPVPPKVPLIARHGWAIAALSFVLGAAIVLGYSAMGGTFPWNRSPPVANVVSQFSLYDFLAVSPVSPRGTSPQSVPAEQWSNLVRQQWDGKSSPKDSAEAAYWLKQVVLNGITPNQVKALTALGYLEAGDIQGASGPEAARLLWEMAATRGGCEALLNLGHLQETEASRPPGARKEAALRWYQRAAAVKCDQAQEAINRLSRQP
jgi:hypothetical protein